MIGPCLKSLLQKLLQPSNGNILGLELQAVCRQSLPTVTLNRLWQEQFSLQLRQGQGGSRFTVEYVCPMALVLAFPMHAAPASVAARLIAYWQGRRDWLHFEGSIKNGIDFRHDCNGQIFIRVNDPAIALWLQSCMTISAPSASGSREVVDMIYRLNCPLCEQLQLSPTAFVLYSATRCRQLATLAQNHLNASSTTLLDLRSISWLTSAGSLRLQSQSARKVLWHFIHSQDMLTDDQRPFRQRLQTVCQLCVALYRWLQLPPSSLSQEQQAVRYGILLALMTFLEDIGRSWELTDSSI